MHIAFTASYPIFVDFQKNFAGKIIDPTYLIKLEIIGKGENSHSVIVTVSAKTLHVSVRILHGVT